MSTSKTTTNKRKRRSDVSVAGAPTRAPIHPGALLRLDVLPALGLSITDAAKQLGVTRQTLHRIMAEEASISAEMALRLGRFCGNGPGLWLRMQQAYDLCHTERRMKDQLARIPQNRQAA